MLSMLKEALEWLNRAEDARVVAGQLTDPGARKAVPKASIGSPEPPQPRLCSGEGDPDFRPQVVPHSFMEISHVARSEPSPLRIVFAENEPEGGRGQKAEETAR